MAIICHAALIAWSLWLAFNLLLMLVASFVIRPNQPCFTGFSIVIPAWVIAALSTSELAAINAHERGHRAHWHPWRNFLAVCLFATVGPETRQRQEHEADDYAAARGHGVALALALMKLSTHPNDMARVERLLRKE